MDKCREAFEKTPDIAKRISKGVYFNEDLKIYREIKGSCRGATFVNGAWCVWQSRQAELDQAYEDIETFVQAHQRECDIKVQIANELKEKDMRIEEALYALKGLKAENDLWGCDQVEVQIEILEKALRGEHE